MTEIKKPLAQPKQEPVAWRWKTHKRNYYKYSEENYHELEGEPLYASPPKREPLSDDEIEDIYEEHSFTVHAFARAIEKAHGIGI